MSIPRLSGGSAFPGLRSGMLVVVAGLFGMHGLSGHGVQRMDMVPVVTLTSPSTTGVLMHMNSGAVGVDGQQVATIDRPHLLAVGASGLGGMDMCISVMCVAVLGAALLALLQVLRRERPTSSLWTRPPRTRVTMRPGRGRAPPSFTDLSIQRC